MADADTPSDLPAYAGKASHDLNNLLMVIIGHADLLAETLPEGDAARDSAAEILEAALKAQTLSNNLLEAARAARRPSAA
ncbi:MAG TPA: histidine kinase dimerization/phospho-acceptor domain-containing protein [Devosia sp.]|nr:histidine kinase dimerization/phospho-acceptor domain-containing protein [Devosia sp.]